jgi:Spy/CpxP family protein refolding chaperone
MKKKLVAIALAVGLALTAGSAIAASAHGGRGPGGNLDGVLTGLKDKGTLTQSQIDAIKKALEEQRTSEQSARVAEATEFQKLITTTIGLDSATITTRLKAGESLGAIAGAKRQALIDALIAFHTKKIDQGVTDGKLTAAQATTLKAGLSASVTFFVDRVPGSLGGRGHGPGFDHPGMGPRGDDHMGKGHSRGHGGMKGQKGKGKSSSTSNTGFNA